MTRPLFVRVEIGKRSKLPLNLYQFQVKYQCGPPGGENPNLCLFPDIGKGGERLDDLPDASVWFEQNVFFDVLPLLRFLFVVIGIVDALHKGFAVVDLVGESRLEKRFDGR